MLQITSFVLNVLQQQSFSIDYVFIHVCDKLEVIKTSLTTTNYWNTTSHLRLTMRGTLITSSTHWLTFQYVSFRLTTWNCSFSLPCESVVRQIHLSVVLHPYFCFKNTVGVGVVRPTTFHVVRQIHVGVVRYVREYGPFWARILQRVVLQIQVYLSYYSVVRRTTVFSKK